MTRRFPPKKSNVYQDDFKVMEQRVAAGRIADVRRNDGARL